MQETNHNLVGATAALAIPLILIAIYITKFLEFLDYIFGLRWDLFMAQKDGSDISERAPRQLSIVSSQQQAVPTQNIKGSFWNGFRRRALLTNSASRQSLSSSDPERGEGEARNVNEDQNVTPKGNDESEK
jgi:hypothetical protein